MKNTVIKEIGNSRYLRSVANFLTLYPTYEAFAQALITGTLPVDVLGINPAGVQQAGDPLNKETLLKDATAAMYGLPDTAVPDDVLAAIPMGVNAGWQLLQEWTTAGTYTWTAPDLFGGEDYEIGVLVIGAGGSGLARVSTGSTSSVGFCGGGASGKSISFLEVVSPGTIHNLVVGEGGASIVKSGSGAVLGNNGGSSSFDSKSTPGGEGGKHSNNRGGNCSAGASPALCGYAGLYGGSVFLGGDEYSYYNGVPSMCFDPFELKLMLGSGGGSAYNSLGPGGKSPYNGKGGGNGDFKNGANAVAESADETGCGGGSACAYAGSGTYKATSGAGADGAVKIYIRRVSA